MIYDTRNKTIQDSRSDAGSDIRWCAWLVYKFAGGGKGDCEVF